MSKTNRWMMIIALACAAGCAASTSTEGLSAADLEPDVSVAKSPLVGGQLAVDTWLSVGATAPRLGAVMRQWAASNAPVLRHVALDGLVRVATAAPTNNYYQVVHGSTWGWIEANELYLAHTPQTGLTAQRNTALSVARGAMGFSYWWSNARWATSGAITFPSSNKGTCTGNCVGNPIQCQHAATGATEYGSDCSGLVSTAWGFPDQNPDTNPLNNGFATSTYALPHANWTNLALITSARQADAVVRNQNGSGHIVLVATRPNGAGLFRTYECEGCSTGCRSRSRTIANNNADGWHAIRRNGAGWAI